MITRISTENKNINVIRRGSEKQHSYIYLKKECMKLAIERSEKETNKMF